MDPKFEEKYSRYEIARILGARSLQLAMDAPILVKLSKEEQDDLNYDVLKIAEKEFESNVLPITVKRPLPKKSEKEIKVLTDKEVQEKLEAKAEREKKEIEKIEEKKKILEKTEEKEIMEDGEIMKMANPEDEVIEEDSDSPKEI